MKKSELIEVLERNLKVLKDPNIPEKLPLYHSLDTGGYTGDCSQIYHFDMGFSYDEDDCVLFFDPLIRIAIRLFEPIFSYI